ncbi:MAG: DUF6075 family protein [Candidatus Woesearchaeota archaeon]
MKYLYSTKGRFNQLMELDGTNEKDVERKALFHIIAGNEDLYKKKDFIYDFKENCISPECFENEAVDFCSSSKKLIELGFNLFNNYPTNSIINIFAGLDQVNFKLALDAIKIRYNK